jgi:hypothetical protein
VRHPAPSLLGVVAALGLGAGCLANEERAPDAVGAATVSDARSDSADDADTGSEPVAVADTHESGDADFTDCLPGDVRPPEGGVDTGPDDTDSDADDIIDCWFPEDTEVGSGPCNDLVPIVRCEHESSDGPGVIDSLFRGILHCTATIDPAQSTVEPAFHWWFVARPAGSMAHDPLGHPESTDDVYVDFDLATGDSVGPYVIAVEAVAPDGSRSCAPTTFEVDVPPPPGIYVELTWTGDLVDDGVPPPLPQPQLHLHLKPADACYYDESDCYFANFIPDWGEPGSGQNPRLDPWGEVETPGISTLWLRDPPVGSYRLGVALWDLWGHGRADARLNVWAHGVLLRSYEQALTTFPTAVGDEIVPLEPIWTVLELAFPAVSITDVNTMNTTLEGRPCD